MPLIYKVDVLQSLKNNGFNTTKLRRNKILSESTIQKLRESKPISWANLEHLCELLECQPNDIIVYVNDKASTD